MGIRIIILVWSLTCIAAATLWNVKAIRWLEIQTFIIRGLLISWYLTTGRIDAYSVQNQAPNFSEITLSSYHRNTMTANNMTQTVFYNVGWFCIRLAKFRSGNSCLSKLSVTHAGNVLSHWLRLSANIHTNPTMVLQNMKYYIIFISRQEVYEVGIDDDAMTGSLSPKLIFFKYLNPNQCCRYFHTITAASFVNLQYSSKMIACALLKYEQHTNCWNICPGCGPQWVFCQWNFSLGPISHS